MPPENVTSSLCHGNQGHYVEIVDSTPHCQGYKRCSWLANAATASNDQLASIPGNLVPDLWKLMVFDDSGD